MSMDMRRIYTLEANLVYIELTRDNTDEKLTVLGQHIIAFWPLVVSGSEIGTTVLLSTNLIIHVKEDYDSLVAVFEGPSARRKPRKGNDNG